MSGTPVAAVSNPTCSLMSRRAWSSPAPSPPPALLDAGEHELRRRGAVLVPARPGEEQRRDGLGAEETHHADAHVYDREILCVLRRNEDRVGARRDLGLECEDHIFGGLHDRRAEPERHASGSEGNRRTRRKPAREAPWPQRSWLSRRSSRSSLVVVHDLGQGSRAHQRDPRALNGAEFAHRTSSHPRRSGEEPPAAPSTGQTERRGTGRGRRTVRSTRRSRPSVHQFTSSAFTSSAGFRGAGTSCQMA